MAGSPVMYISQIRGSLWAKKRLELQRQIDSLKQGNYDKAEMKRKKKELIQQMNECQFEMQQCADDAMKENHQTVTAVLTAFMLMDMVTRGLDYIEKTFKSITVGNKKNDLLNFVKLCKIAAATANEVVTTIDKAGNEMMSMAYADIEDDIGDHLFNELLNYIEQYSKTPEGRKLFFGN
jgi:hypothetical protein